jgi:hypothetical protein
MTTKKQTAKDKSRSLRDDKEKEKDKEKDKPED